VPEFWVVNASPVITLAKAGHLDLLTRLANDVLVPEAVVVELLDASVDDPARQAIERGWGTRISGINIPVNILEWGLGGGETSVLAVTLQDKERTAVLDDAQGRKCARALGIPVVGTLGIVLRAKRQGYLASASEAIRDLRAAGLYLNDVTISLALERSVGEEWKP
jgi:predicted nucleic acid-binding protein